MRQLRFFGQSYGNNRTIIIADIFKWETTLIFETNHNKTMKKKYSFWFWRGWKKCHYYAFATECGAGKYFIGIVSNGTETNLIIGNSYEIAAMSDELWWR